jgi:hypothetical protein
MDRNIQNQIDINTVVKKLKCSEDVEREVMNFLATEYF